MKYGVQSGQITTWKRAALDNMAPAFRRRGRDPEPDWRVAPYNDNNSKFWGYIPIS